MFVFYPKFMRTYNHFKNLMMAMAQEINKSDELPEYCCGLWRFIRNNTLSALAITKFLFDIATWVIFSEGVKSFLLLVNIGTSCSMVILMNPRLLWKNFMLTYSSTQEIHNHFCRIQIIVLRSHRSLFKLIKHRSHDKG